MVFSAVLVGTCLIYEPAVGASCTVPLELGNVMMLFAVGSVTLKVVVKPSSVAPWKTSASWPSSWLVTVSRSVVALPMVVLPLKLAFSATVSTPLTVVVMPAREMLRALAFVAPTLKVAAPPVSRVKALAPPLVMPSAPLAVRAVEVPKDTVPLPACKVKLPAVVLQVAAAAEVIVSAPAVVLIVLAAPAVELMAAPLCKVIAPALALPIVTAPVLVPVLMFVALLADALMFVVPVTSTLVVAVRPMVLPL